MGPVRVLLLLTRGVFLDRAELAAEVFGMDRFDCALSTMVWDMPKSRIKTLR